MKKLFFVLLLFVGTKSFCQTSNITYFGGIYDKQLYFNWVMHNTDTLYFVVETSIDGRDYQELFCDSVNPMPAAIMHGIKMATTETQILVKVIAKTSGKVMYFQPEVFCKDKYTYIPTISIMISRPIHGDF